MNRPLYVFFPCFLLLLFASCATEVQACLCESKPSVLDYFERADVVIVGRVTSANHSTKEPEVREVDVEDKTATIEVEHSFKGDKRKGDEIVLSQVGFNSCTWIYDRESVGLRVLLYLGGDSNGRPVEFQDSLGRRIAGFRMEACGRGGTVEGSADDLKYLNRLNELKGRSRISGTIEPWSPGREGPSVSGIKINIYGDKEDAWSVRSDENGVYEIYDLPEGVYWIEVEVPHGWKVDEYSQPSFFGVTGEKPQISKRGTVLISVYLHKNRHVGLDLSLSIYNRISGVVRDAKMRPLHGVEVRAISTASENSLFGEYRATTNSRGEFSLEGLASGTYHIAALKDPTDMGTGAFPIGFYPAGGSRSDAPVFTMAPGSEFLNLEFSVRQFRHAVEVRGRVRNSSGVPIRDVRIEFTPATAEDGYGNRRTAYTDVQGDYRLLLWKGAKGTVRGSKSITAVEIDSCPALKSFKGLRGAELDKTSQQISIVAEPDSVLDPLVIDIPYCSGKEK